MGFSGDSVIKNLPANTGNTRDMGLNPGSGRSLGVGNTTTPIFSPGKSHGQRNLSVYSPRGHKESDST